jgi:hypothetical protein
VSIFLKQSQSVPVITATGLVIFFLPSSIAGQTGTINIRSQSPGALIWIDDQDVGITPVINRTINKQHIGKTTTRILPGVAAAGFYTWGCFQELMIIEQVVFPVFLWKLPALLVSNYFSF